MACVQLNQNQLVTLPDSIGNLVNLTELDVCTRGGLDGAGAEPALLLVRGHRLTLHGLGDGVDERRPSGRRPRRSHRPPV